MPEIVRTAPALLPLRRPPRLSDSASCRILGHRIAAATLMVAKAAEFR
jgi:hypothetical protein